jgi:hypothetical protein
VALLSVLLLVVVAVLVSCREQPPPLPVSVLASRHQ